jgi:ABC-type uncharacterized transport system substrate-binding protein
MSWKSFFISGIIMLFVSGAAPAYATPSIHSPEIEFFYTALFRNGLLQGWQAEWLFDTALSEMIIADFDTDQNGSFEKNEVVDLNKASLPTLHDSGYFLNMLVDGHPVPVTAVSGINATIESRRVRYHYKLGLLNGDVDIRKSEVIAQVLDPTGLTTLIPATTSVRLGKGAPADCVVLAEQADGLMQQQRRNRRGSLFGPVVTVKFFTVISFTCGIEQQPMGVK